MHVVTPFGVLLLLQRGERGAARPDETPCLTRRQCNAQRKKLGLTKFQIGSFETKGCFSKGGQAYFGTGGSVEDRSKAVQSGDKKRIWCEGSSRPVGNDPATAPARPAAASPSRSACLSEKECNLRRQDLGITRYKVGDFPVKGCFSRGRTVFFGTGGTDPARLEAPLSGKKERIWCDTKDAGDCIDIQVNTGELFSDGEAGFELSTKPGDGSDPQKLWAFPVGSLESESEYQKRLCDVPNGAYALTVVGRSSYSARVAGRELLFGKTPWGETRSHDLLIGHYPAMNDNEKAWLDEHNTRREAFHQNHNKEYRPLRWSAGLARHASDRIDDLLPTCRYVREPRLEEGELVAISNYRASGPRETTEVPANILPRWADRNRDRGYPANQKWTQVVWRATRYVGCATKFVENGGGSYCHVSVCRYARPGNCGANAENWLAKTLDEHSLCGTACPPEGCH